MSKACCSNPPDTAVTLAIINTEKCQPTQCHQECMRSCPVVKNGHHCIDINFVSKSAMISEELCIGCGACTTQCPFRAIKVVRIPKNLEKQVTHRFGINGFKLHGLPIPRPGHFLGLLGANGTGKSTAFKVLSGQLKPNLGRHNTPPEWPDILKFFKGSELQRYLTRLKDQSCKVTTKPQHVEQLARTWSGTVADVWQTSGGAGDERWLQRFGLQSLTTREVDQLSGGELQRLAIAVTCAQVADVYLFDEPTSYLDVRQRLHMVRNIRDLLEEDDTRSLVAVEHDLSTLDYLSDTVAFFCGEPGAYGVATSPYGVAQGINLFLDGFIPSENFRFREGPLDFEIEKAPAMEEDAVVWQYPSAICKMGSSFTLTIEGGEVATSEVIVMLGENGMGKSTFIKVLTGQLPIEGGSSMPSIKASVKPQSVSIKETSSVAKLTVKEVLDQKVHKNLASDESWNVEVIGPLRIEELFSKQMIHLSGGELQRVSLALALGKWPADVYMVDEPSAYLDCEQRVTVCKVLRNFMRRHKKTAFVIEHDVMMAAYLADKVVVFQGTPAISSTASSPQPLLNGMNHFLQSLDVTFRSDIETHRPRINKLGSVKDREQKAAGQYFYMQ